MLRCILMLMASRYSESDVPLQWNPDAAFWRAVPPTIVAADNYGKAQVAN